MGERADLAERINAPPDPMLLPPSDAELLEQEIACITRELAFRRAVYRRRVANNKMSAGKAQHEISVMQRVLHRLIRIKERQTR